MPDWILTFAYWLHMAATVVWIGGLFFHGVILKPSFIRQLSAESEPAFLEMLLRRFEPLVWLSLAVLIATGLIQMSANPNYQGILVLTNRWSQAILIKHIAIFLMLLLASFQTWYLRPRLVRTALRLTRSLHVDEKATTKLLKSALIAARLNLLLGTIVLALTAVARTS